jgi:agmatinase
MGEIVERGIATVVQDAVDHARARAPRTYLTVDVDVLDPAFAPGTGTPEPGGLSSRELLYAVRTLASRTDVVGVDVVEVLPTAVGSADLAALVADRIVREALTGVAVRRRAGVASGAARRSS